MKITNTLLIRPSLRGWALALAVVGGLLAITGTSQAQTQVYSENFDVDTTANWTVNKTTGGDNRADIFFDYSTVGIPPAPNSGGTTRGLKLQANLTPALGVFPSGVSVSPNGFSITENFEMHWDMWINYNGPLNGGGSGSTQIAGGGYGTAGTSVNVAGSGIDAIIIGASGDGGTASDYRVYSPGKPVSYQDGQYILGGGFYGAGYSDFRPGDTNSGFVYAGAGSRNSSATYYATNFPAGQTAPAAQIALYPQQTGSTAAGTVAFKWRDVSIRKVANTITYRIDGILIATIDAVDAITNTIPPGSIVPLGGANILFNHYDINTGASADPNAQYLAFSLFDNVRITNFPSVVTATATTPNASETGPTPGVFTITRSEPGPAVTVYYTMSGAAVSGSDYVALPGSVAFAVGETSTNVTLTPIDDGVSEFAETAVLNISEGTNYYGAGNATVTIADNDTPTLDISTVQGSMYEPLPNDYVRFRLTRRGNLDAPSFNVNLSYAGEAAASRHTGTTPVTVNPGSLTTDFDVKPVNDALLQGNQTVVCSVADGTGYAVGTNSPSATATIVDDELPTETVLFADDFNTDTSAAWTLLYASTNATDNDYSVTFNYDYSLHPYGALPPAPRSGTDTHGLFLQVNKLQPDEAAAALNLYPKNKTFSGNFALRFDMYLIAPDTATTEYALFGINHSGNQTNWFRNSTFGFTGVDPTGWTFDGLFYGVETDAAALGDYALYSAPTTAGRNPTSLNSRSASTLTGIFKAPPYGFAGSPGNISGSTTPCWSEVEISQVGDLVTLKINQTVIFSYTNTTAFTSGNVMLGHCDAYDSAASFDGGVIYDNVRVISLPVSVTPAEITSIVPVGTPATSYNVNYAGGSGTQFVLLTSPTVNALLSGWTRAATNSTGSGTFSVSAGAQAFYRIKSE
ncbi:MAG TPA: Calx-beta domain-containing protein [Verrucomicrobiota bacterium]|nr:Calx-beta domain-containing protein [Verrucomicrobiota bacterium]HQL79027.1 Calx-beta domain-containing protein [Verrucomicrobiota bacterium]